MLDATGLPVGVLEECEFPPSEIVSLAPGDCLLLMIDRAFELPNADEEQFGVARIKRVLRESCHLPAQQIVETLRKAITAFNPHQLPPDDITLLVLKRSDA